MSRDRGEKTRRTSSSKAKTKAQKPAKNQRGKRGGDEGGVEKTSILSMDFSDIGQALSRGSSKRSGKAETPDQWVMRANLMPKSIIALNRDRAIKYLLAYVLAAVLIAAIVVSGVMMAQVGFANHRTDKAQEHSIALQKQRAKYKDVEDTLNLLADSQVARVSMLYDEIDWYKVADGLNGALPANGKYTNLKLSEYRLGGDNQSSSSSTGDNTSSVWASKGVISIDFTVQSPDFVSAEAFISNFSHINGYMTGDVSSITNGSDSDQGYTYTGSVSIDLTDNTTSRGDNSAGAVDSHRALLKQLRENLTKTASGTEAGNASASNGTSNSSTSSSSN